MKINDTEAHVCVRNLDVNVGDKMAVFRSECTASPASTKIKGTTQCKLVKLGDGTITEELNDHYSTVRFSAPLAYREGDLLEKVVE